MINEDKHNGKELEEKEKRPKSEKVIVKGREVIVSSQKVETFDTTELRTVPRGEIQLNPKKPHIKPPPEHQEEWREHGRK